jgi:hypothetical protein
VSGRRVAWRSAKGLRATITLLEFSREDEKVALKVRVFIFARSKLNRFRNSAKGRIKRDARES